MGLSASPQGKLLVTGARGFIGRAFCARLRHAGITHVAAVRALGPDAAVFPADLALGDFAGAEWERVLSSVDTIVHLAGRAHAVPGSGAGGATLYVVANVHVTRRLAEAAARAKVRRIVFASSVKVCGEATEPGRPFGADDVPAPQDEYARSKAEAENVLREICGAGGVELVVLRLPLTYGPGVRGNFLALLEAVAARRRLPLRGVANRRSLLYLGNAVSAFETAVVSPALAGHSVCVADAEAVSTPALIDRLARSLRVESRSYRVPTAMLRVALPLLGRGAEAARLLGSLEIDPARFTDLTGWTPPHSLDEGLEVTARWWRTRHAL